MEKTQAPADHDAPEVYDRPLPGPRQPRAIWTGRSEVWLSEVSADPAEPMRNVAGGGRRDSHLMLKDIQERDRRRRRGRSVGVDAARGIALLGMFAVHMLPATSQGRPTLTWVLFAGNSASLFAVLAGIIFGFSSGAETPARGSRLRRSYGNMVFRALLLLGIGLAINEFDLETYNILVYFAVMFVLAVPLTHLRAGPLLSVAAVMIIVMPMVRFLIHQQVTDFGWYPNPTFGDVISDPLGVFTTLTVTGIYPALTWLGLICLGMGIGRLPLYHTIPRLSLVVVGLLTTLATLATSVLIIDRFGGFSAVASSFPGESRKAIKDFMNYGPDAPLPTETPGWLLVAGPHTNTAFALAIGAGFAMMVLGVLMMLAKWSKALLPLIDMGRMPLTLYTTHMIMLALVPDSVNTTWLFFVQVLVALGFASVWFTFFRRGPVEAFMALATRFLLRVFGLGKGPGSTVIRERV